MASINLLLGLCTKYQTLFPPLNKEFLLEGGNFEERSHIAQITYNDIVKCMNESGFFLFFFSLPFSDLKKKRLI